MYKYQEIYISSILQAQSGDRWTTTYFRFELLSPVGVLSQWRAIEGTLINFSGTQILRRRRRKVFFPSLLWKRSYRPTESTLISAPLSIKTFVFSVPVKKRRRTTSRLTCVRGKKEGRRLFFSSWAFCDCGILEIFCCSYCLAVIQKLAKNLIFTGVGIRKAATYAPKGRGDFR